MNYKTKIRFIRLVEKLAKRKIFQIEKVRFLNYLIINKLEYLHDITV